MNRLYVDLMLASESNAVPEQMLQDFQGKIQTTGILFW